MHNAAAEICSMMALITSGLVNVLATAPHFLLTDELLALLTFVLVVIWRSGRSLRLPRAATRGCRNCTFFLLAST